MNTKVTSRREVDYVTTTTTTTRNKLTIYE